MLMGLSLHHTRADNKTGVFLRNRRIHFSRVRVYSSKNDCLGRSSLRFHRFPLHVRHVIERVRVGEQTLQQACSQEYPGSARCVQRFDDSLDSAIRITYRISLRSSSMWEPRHPSLKVVLEFRFLKNSKRRKPLVIPFESFSVSLMEAGCDWGLGFGFVVQTHHYM
jgi:hypothetical protein